MNMTYLWDYRIFLKTKKLRLIRVKMNKSEHNFIFDIKFFKKNKAQFWKDINDNFIYYNCSYIRLRYWIILKTGHFVSGFVFQRDVKASLSCDGLL